MAASSSCERLGQRPAWLPVTRQEFRVPPPPNYLSESPLEPVILPNGNMRAGSDNLPANAHSAGAPIERWTNTCQCWTSSPGPGGPSIPCGQLCRGRRGGGGGGRFFWGGLPPFLALLQLGAKKKASHLWVPHLRNTNESLVPSPDGAGFTCCSGVSLRFSVAIVDSPFGRTKSGWGFK